MPTPLPSFLAMHHFDAPPRISAAQPEDVAIKDRGASSERDEQFDLLEVRSCGSIDEKSESDADEFKDLSPEKTSEMAEKIEQVSDPTEKLNLSPEHKAKDAMKPLQTQVERQDTAKFGETQRELFPRTEAETKQEDDILFDKLEEKLLPESLDKQAAMPALMLSRLPGPGRPEEEKAEAAPELLDMLSKVSAQVATLQSELASLRASMDSLHEEFQELRVERPTAKPSSAVEEQLAELKSSVKRELHDVQEVLNSELKDLTSLFRGEMQQLSDKVQALDAADTQLLQNINALTLDCAALQGAFKETRPAVANLAHAQSALGSAQRETEKQLNASILRQKSDALALNARVMEMEGGWTGLFGCYCKRRRPREAAKPELSSQLDPQQIPSDAERPRGQSVTLDDD